MIQKCFITYNFISRNILETVFEQIILYIIDTFMYYSIYLLLGGLKRWCYATIVRYEELVIVSCRGTETLIDGSPPRVIHSPCNGCSAGDRKHAGSAWTFVRYTSSFFPSSIGILLSIPCLLQRCFTSRYVHEYLF